MSYGFLASIGLFISLWLAAADVTGQTLPSSAKANPAAHWTPPRTPGGKPDLQGIWTNATLTPLERPPELAGKQVLTQAEAAAYEKQRLQQENGDLRKGSGEVVAYNELWYDRGTKVVGDRRTSLIVDPPDGRVPPLTPEAQKRVD